MAGNASSRHSRNQAGSEVEVDKRFRATLPEAFHRELPEGSEQLACMESDMTREGPVCKGMAGGDFATRWSRLRKTFRRMRVALNEIDEVEVDELFSAGRLLVKTNDGATRALISYSRNLVPEFAAAARMIDRLSDGHDLVYPDLEGPAISDSGVPLPRRGGHSPLDVPRWKILGRLTEFLVPYKSKVIALMVLIFVSVLAQMATPLLTKYIVDGILRDANATRRRASLRTGARLLRGPDRAFLCRHLVHSACGEFS